MKMIRLNIQLPEPMKAKVDALRVQGITASGLIRRLLNEHFGVGLPTTKGGRKHE